MQVLALILLATSAGDVTTDGETVIVYHRDASEAEVVAAGLEAIERQGDLRQMSAAERFALAERLLDVPSEGDNPVVMSRAVLRDQALKLLAAKDTLSTLRLTVEDTDRQQAKMLTRALKRMGIKRLRHGGKRADVRISLDSETRLSPHPIFEYRNGFASVTVYGVLPDGASVVTVAKAERKALGAMRAVKRAEKEAMVLALHGLLFDIAARRDSQSLAAW